MINFKNKIKAKIDVLYGGQYGSESKRLFTEFYTKMFKTDTIISNFGPNSGGFDSFGSKWSVFPIGFDGNIMLSAGSIIPEERFWKEAEQLPSGANIVIHPNACVVNDDHRQREADRVTIGSTMTGTMEAVVQKMRRDPNNINTAANSGLREFVVSQEEWLQRIVDCESALVVVPQGHSLSINHGMYPFCTSRNTSPQQGLADAGIPIWLVRDIIGCFRTYPIRVANRYDDDGNMIGYSGPCYDDQKEMTWDEIGVPAEYTSISKKMRRVFNFSIKQYVESVLMNGCTKVFMNFMNYLGHADSQQFLVNLNELGLPARVEWAGYGPKCTDIAKVKYVDKAEYEKMMVNDAGIFSTLRGGFDNPGREN